MVEKQMLPLKPIKFEELVAEANLKNKAVEPYVYNKETMVNVKPKKFSYSRPVASFDSMGVV